MYINSSISCFNLKILPHAYYILYKSMIIVSFREFDTLIVSLFNKRYYVISYFHDNTLIFFTFNLSCISSQNLILN